MHFTIMVEFQLFSKLSEAVHLLRLLASEIKETVVYKYHIQNFGYPSIQQYFYFLLKYVPFWQCLLQYFSMNHIIIFGNNRDFVLLSLQTLKLSFLFASCFLIYLQPDLNHVFWELSYWIHCAIWS